MAIAAQPVLSGRRKAAVLLVLLGNDAATGICKHLNKEEQRLLAQEIAELDSIPPELAAEVLHEYQRSAAKPAMVAQGGPDYATKLLVKTLGDEGSRPLVDQVIKTQEVIAQNLEALQKADPQQLGKLLQAEHPQTVALVLAHLNPNLARSVLMLLSEELRAKTVKRLAQMQNLSPEMVSKISVVMQRKLQTTGEDDRRAYGGVKAVADLLNRMGGKVTTDILAGIEQDNANLAASIRNQMFTFEDFAEVPEIGLRELLTQVDKKMLATALKGASENLSNHFYKCMSSRAVEMLKEDTEALGPMKSKDVTQAQLEIIKVARKLESEGKMTLRNEVEEAYVV